MFTKTGIKFVLIDEQTPSPSSSAVVQESGIGSSSQMMRQKEETRSTELVK